jgi:glycosyltransferase involved in cell wall biosynthesis
MPHVPNLRVLNRPSFGLRVKVCVISPAFYPAIVYGGPIFSIYHTCIELAKQGMEIFVSTTNANGKGKLEVTPNRLVRLGERFFVKYYDDTIVGRFSWKFALLVWRDIRACDVVRIEDIFSSYIPPSLFYAKLFGKPTLISPRGVLSDWSLANKRALLKRIWLALFIKPFLRNSWWHATSEQEKIEILDFYPKAKVVVIPNGIEVHQFSKVAKLSRSEYLRKFANIDGSAKIVVVSMGRLHKKKGFDVLIDAFAGLLADFGDAILLIAGKDDGEKRNLESQIARLGLVGKVFLVGEVSGEEKVAFLGGADLFALPSHSENFGNVYLEAMAAGLPVVASKGTPWERVDEVGCGRWVENTVEATRAAMRDILKGDTETMGKRGQDYAKEYDWQSIAKRFRAVLQEMNGA